MSCVIERSDVQFHNSAKRPLYVCRIVVYEDTTDGGYVAYAQRLPGVVTQGETIEEALAAAKESYAFAIESYVSAGDEIPFQEDWYKDIIAGEIVARREFVFGLDD